MSKAIQAALLSAFVFPGAGHFLLKHPWRALIFLSLAALSSYFLLSNALEMAYDIKGKIERGEIPMDLARISLELAEQRKSKDDSAAQVAVGALALTWLVAVVDAFRLGRKQAKVAS